MAEWLGTRLIICSTLVQTQLNAYCLIKNKIFFKKYKIEIYMHTKLIEIGTTYFLLSRKKVTIY